MHDTKPHMFCLFYNSTVSLSGTPTSKVKQRNTTQHLKHFTSIPYVQGTSKRIGRILNEPGVKVAMKPVKTIGNILTSLKDSIAEHEKSRLLYQIPFADCEFVYVAQTNWDLKNRVAEHKELSKMQNQKNPLYVNT